MRLSRSSEDPGSGRRTPSVPRPGSGASAGRGRIRPAEAAAPPGEAQGETASRRAELVLPYGVGGLDIVVPAGVLPDPLAAPGNRLSWPGAKLVFKRVVADFSVDAVTDRAASLTYYTLLAIAPAILATYSLVLMLLPRDGTDAPQMLRDLLARYVPEALQSQAVELLDTIVGTPAENTIALAVSVAVSLLSASAYVRSFSRNANVIYGRIEGRTLVVTWVTMWAVTLVLEAGALVIILAALLRESIITGVLAPVARPLGLTGEVEYLTGIFLPVWSWLQLPFIVLVSLGLVSMLFYFTPNARRGRFRPFTPGSVFAVAVSAASWTVFTLYLSAVGVRSAYGAFGTVLTVLVLVWFMNVVLLLGVKIDAEVLRARELQVGYDAERVIQAQPKSMEAVQFRLRVQRWLDRAAEDVKNRNA